MTEAEIYNVVLNVGELYLKRGIFYRLDLKHCTKEEFENMNEQAKEQIDYFSDDINEEDGKRMSKNNMHTRTGRGVKTSQMSLMTCDGKKSALDIVISMVETYRKLNPSKANLPVLTKWDIDFLGMLVNRIKNAEYVSYWHDQKSAEFFKDEQGQRRYIVPAQTIGKATVLKSKETFAKSAQEEKNSEERIASDIREVKQMQVDDKSNNSFPEGHDE